MDESARRLQIEITREKRASLENDWNIDISTNGQNHTRLRLTHEQYRKLHGAMSAHLELIDAHRYSLIEITTDKETGAIRFWNIPEIGEPSR